MDRSTYGKLSAPSQQSRHTNIYIHTIITALKKHTGPVTFREVEKETGISVERTPQLLELLGKNKKVIHRGNTLEFVPTHTIRDEASLLALLESTRSQHGIPLEEILDTNMDVRPIVDSVVASGRAIVLKGLDGSAVIFYNGLVEKKASPSVLKLYEDVAVPEIREVTRALSSVGLATQTTERPLRRQAPAQRKKRYVRKIKITNTHIDKRDLGM